jgi:NO-binding membrane sensor protein with MHYT domain
MATAILQFVIGVIALVNLVQDGSIEAWQYIAGAFILILGLVFMAYNGMHSSGVNPADVPKKARENVIRLRNENRG